MAKLTRRGFIGQTSAGAVALGVDSSKAVNVHTIAIQVPMDHLTRNGARPTNPAAAASVVGDRGMMSMDAGPWVQVSRLGNPLIMR